MEVLADNIEGSQKGIESIYDAIKGKILSADNVSMNDYSDGANNINGKFFDAAGDHGVQSGLKSSEFPIMATSINASAFVASGSAGLSVEASISNVDDMDIASIDSSNDIFSTSPSADCKGSSINASA